MAEFSNTNRGAIWKNKRKELDTHPDFTGSLNVDGVEYWVSAWKRKEDAPDKAPALSFSVKPKEGADAKPAQSESFGRQPAGGRRALDLDDEVPFAPEWR